MDKTLSDYRRRARQIAAELETPGFQVEAANALLRADETFFDEPIILRLREDMIPLIYDDHGLGIEHAKRVSIDAGAIVLVEAVRDADKDRARRLSLLAMLAGLLHDTERLEPDEGRRAADVARAVLADYPLTDTEREIVAAAIAAHPALIAPDIADPDMALVAAALYDADVFRWGPDFFVTALWELCDYDEMENAQALDCLDTAPNAVAARRGTFRTAVGQRHGPQLLDIGLDLARRIRPELDVFRRDITSFRG